MSKNREAEGPSCLGGLLASSEPQSSVPIQQNDIKEVKFFLDGRDEKGNPSGPQQTVVLTNNGQELWGIRPRNSNNFGDWTFFPHNEKK